MHTSPSIGVLGDCPVHILLEDHMSPAVRDVLMGAAHALELIEEVGTITLPDRRFIYVNSAFERVYGISCAAMLGRTVPPLHTRAVSDQLVENIYEGTRSGGWTGMLENQNRSGARFEIRLRTRPLLTACGELAGYLGISHPASWQRVPEECVVLRPQRVEGAGGLVGLSTRERDVLCCYGKGMDTKEIAQALRISTASVFTYRSRISAKLGLKSPAEFYIAAAKCCSPGTSEATPNL